MLRRKLLIDINSEPRRITRVHQTVRKRIAVREHAISFKAMAHVFLYAKIVHAQIEMQRSGHAYRTHVRSTVTTGAHVVQLRKAGNLPQMRNAARMHNSRANVVDQLLLNQQLTIVDRVEHFSDSN